MGLRVDYVGEESNALGTQFSFNLGESPNIYSANIELGEWGRGALNVILGNGRLKLQVRQVTSSPDTYRASYWDLENKKIDPFAAFPVRGCNNLYSDLIDASIRSQEKKKPINLRRRSRIPLERLINYFS